MSWTCSNVMQTYARNFRCCLSLQSASSNVKECKKSIKIVRKYVKAYGFGSRSRTVAVLIVWVVV